MTLPLVHSPPHAHSTQVLRLQDARMRTHVAVRVYGVCGLERGSVCEKSDFENGMQEIFINYGNDCNDKFLLNYGFSTQGPTPPCQWPDSDRRTEVAAGEDRERGGSSYSSAYSSSIRALP